MSKPFILVVDDERDMAKVLADFLKTEGYEARTFADGSALVEALSPEGELYSQVRSNQIDLIISDIKMPKLSGLGLLKLVKQNWETIPVILMTAFGSIDSAVEAIREGAYDYIVKPFKLQHVLVSVQRALSFRTVQKKVVHLQETIMGRSEYEGILARSKSMKAIFELVDRVAPSMANVLIHGESGTGKELIAKALHRKSSRRNGPFVAVNCSAIPETLLEAELFGYVKGAFTGANQNKNGLFDEAHGGTLFLDEIGDMPLPLQAKLLRVIQEREVRPVGGTQSHLVDVRLLSATHQNLKNAIAENNFREDLFYRLNVIPINLPPLRERKEDIPLLVSAFLEKFSELNGFPVPKVGAKFLKALERYHWPGNVRELENLMERSVVLAQGQELNPEDLPILEEAPQDSLIERGTKERWTLQQLEAIYIQQILNEVGGSKSEAARILGVNRRTLYRKDLNAIGSTAE